ncbi:PAS domain S-box protein [Mucilaginibacter sp. McL0603]|uniref:PAS domain S-box protein n=1 Tax=Mucilaginibacter sp. McL0603 TaxID=3415670 RepID=UPI003CF6F4B1
MIERQIPVDDFSNFNAIFDNSEDAIINKTSDGEIINWNRAAERIFGYTTDEIVGKNISIIIPDELKQEEDEITQRIQQGERVEHYHSWRITKDKRNIPISLTVSAVKDIDSNFIGTTVIARDISEQQTGEEKQAMLAAIVNSSEDAIISKTLKGIITTWNKAAYKLFGYTDKEAIGKHISLIIPTERLDEENTIISRIKDGLRVEHFETIRIKKDGSLIPISLSVSPIKDSSGTIIGASKIARDITEEIDNREKIKLYYEQLEKINSYKDEFIGLASHELKTPLTSITGYLQLLESTLKEDKSKIFVKRAVNQARKLSLLVSDLLDMSKIQTGNLTLNLDVFDFNDLLDETIITINDTIATHDLELIKPGNPVMLNGDRQRIEQVLINLVNNAVKYSPRANKVIMTVTDTDDKIQVAVKDFGIGIAKNQQQKIFSRFYRVEDTSPSISGLGIGLYISYDIVTKHNGRIWVDSEPGNGSTFYFEIPKEL